MENGKKKLILLIFILFVIISLSDIITSETLNKFSDNTDENTYFGVLGDWGNTTSINIPKYAVVSGATINITGLKYLRDSEYTFEQDTPDEISTSGTWSSTYSASKCYDNNWDTYGRGDSDGYYYFNYTKRVNSNGSSYLYLKVGTTYNYVFIPTSCWNYDTEKVIFYIHSHYHVTTEQRYSKLYCNSGSWGEIFNYGGVSGSSNIYEEMITWRNTDHYPANVTLDVGGDGDVEFNHTEDLSTQNTTLDFASEINSYLSTCSMDSNYSCNIPIILNATNGKIKLSALNIEYIEKPQFNLTSPFNNTETTNKNIAVKYTYIDSNPDKCWWTNNTGITNTTITCGVNLTNMKWKEGTTTIFLYINDTAGNVNSSSVTFTVNSPPAIKVRYPTGTYTNNNQINVNYTVWDDDLDSCWWTNNSGVNKYYFACGTNVTGQLWKDGATTVTVSANDSWGTINSSSVTFIVDRTPPSIVIVSPANNTNTTNKNILIDYTPSDTYLQSCWWTNNSGVTNTTISCYSDLSNMKWKEGTSNVYIYAKDYAGNVNSSSVTFTVDSIKPQIRIIYPNNNTNTDDNNINVNFTVYDIGSGLQSCWWTNNSGVTNTTITCNGNITTGLWKEGTSTIFVYANDSFGNLNSSSVIFKIDTTYPSINIAYPNNNTNTTNNRININFTTYDLVSGLHNCWWTNNTGITNTTITCNGNITTGLWKEGTSTIFVYANDSMGYINYSSVSFYVDSIPPVTTETGTSPPDSDSYSFNTWTNEDVKITLTAVDTGIGFDNLAYPKYCLNISNDCTPNNYISSGVTISTEGISYIRYFSNDTLGNEETIKNQTIKIDKTAPYYTIYYPENYLNLSSNVSINLNFSVSDSSSGINKIWFNLDNGTNTTLTDGINATFNSNEGDRALYFYVNDSLGNLNSTVVYFRVDVTNPNATILTPANNSYNNTAQNFTVNVTDNTRWKNATLFIINSTKSIVNETTFHNPSEAVSLIVGNVVDLVDGVYNWFYRIFDWAGNQFQTSNYTITIDNTKPDIYFNENTYKDGIYSSDDSIFINITISETNVDIINFEWNEVNESFVDNDGTHYWENKTGLSDGDYTFYAWILDKATNYNYTETRTIHVDITDPSVSIYSPVTGTYNYNTSINLNYTVSDVHLDSCWWEIDDGVNESIVCNTNTTFNVSEGVHNIFVYANDSSGRIGFETISFSVSLLPPSINLHYPINNKWINYKDNVQFNYTPSSTGTLNTCELWINKTGEDLKLNHSQTSLSDGEINSFYLNLTDDHYQWNVWCNDTTNNGGFAVNVTFNVDTTDPLITYSNDVLANDINTTNNYIYVNVTIVETNLNNIIFTLFNDTGKVNQTTYIDGTRNITWYNLNDNIYYYNVSVNDSSGNTNQTLTRTIRLDDTSPTISIAEPKAQNYANNNSIALNYTTYDNFIGIKECWYYVNNATSTIITTRSLTTCQNTTFGLPSGDKDYTLYLFSKDLNGNTRSASRVFGIRTNSPSIVLAPSNNSFSNHITNNYFNFTVETNADGISTCELWGNFTGTWAINQTKTSVTESSMIHFDAIGLNERIYLWNVWCNDTLDNNGWALRNNTFTIDLTIPVPIITSIATTSGSQTITAYFNRSDTNLDSSQCKYSIYNHFGNVDGLNNNISISSCNSPFTATVSDYGIYNLTVVIRDLAGNENQTTRSFTTSASTPTSDNKGTSQTAISTSFDYEKATNFSITTINGLSKLDLSLSKDSVRPRIKQFYVINKGLEEITLTLYCETSNQTSNGVNICDYVEIVNKTVTIAPNVQQRVMNEFYISVPENASFDDEYYFNIVAKQKYNQSELYDKLSVSSKVSIFGMFNKWSYLPFQSDVKKDDKKDYPVWSVSLFLSFMLFGIIFFIFNQVKIPFTGFVLGSVIFISSFFMFMFIL